MEFKYSERSNDVFKKLKRKYYSIVKSGNDGFGSVQDFILWYEKQKLECFYCKITEKDCYEIVMNGLLTSGRFPTKGNVKQGKSRGMYLEIDRSDEPKGKYSVKNCVLCCYFCNNDKSDIFNRQQYLTFFQNRTKFLRDLLS